MTTCISNTDGIIDSRDVIARIEALTEEREGLEATVEEATEKRDETQEKLNKARDEFDAARLTDETEVESLEETLEENESALRDAESALKGWDEGDEGQELKALEALQDEAEGYSDWKYGAALIRDDHFEDYARQYAEEIGAVDSNASWPNDCIDWKRAASELQMDYTSVDFDGVTYWIR